MRTLLCATDLGPGSEPAAARALALSEALGARLVVLHVIERPNAATRVEQHVRALISGAGDVLDSGERAGRIEANEALLRRFAGHVTSARPVEWSVAAGAITTSIVDKANEVDADLIVVGCGQLRGVLGTTAERVAKRSARPVLIAKSDGARPYASLVSGADFSDASGRALVLAQKLAPGARCFAVYALEPIFEQRLRWAGADATAISDYRRQLVEIALADLNAQIESLPNVTPPELSARFGAADHVLLEAARQTDADLIALGAVSVRGVGQYLLGSVAARVARQSEQDVLLVP